MDVSDDNVQTLLCMGFPSESEIRRALKLAKNDLSEAVSILTDDNHVSSYDHLEDLDVEMRDVQPTTSTIDRNYNNSSQPPRYEDVLTDDTQQVEHEEFVEEDTGLEFPVPNLVELEGRVFTESWSIPYKREESLGKCLMAATRLANEGLAESDSNCKRFLEKCMPESFQKLLNSGAVHRWGSDIQEGIYDMLFLLIDLVATRLKYSPVPIELLNVLALAFNTDIEFHVKNKSRRPEKATYEEKFGAGNLYAVSSSPGSYIKEPYGWLTNLINRFADKEGFKCVEDLLQKDNLDAPSMAALLAPFGQCAEFLNSKVVVPILGPGMDAAVTYVKGLTEDDRKHKKIGSVCELLASMKLLCLSLWPQDVRAIDELRLEVAIKMLMSPHFNSKMNALKEVTKLIEDSLSSKSKTAIPQEKMLDWLVDQKVLSIALEGNIDQAQYCDKIKNIVDFLGPQLSQDELTKIWKMQNGQTNIVVDNIHSIIIAAGIKFNNSVLVEHLFTLVHSTWNAESDRTKEKLLNLIGQIGRDSINSRTTQKVLEFLWDLAHLPQLSTEMVDLAIEQHLSILNESSNVKEVLKKQYVNKCVDDIKEGKWVLPALKQLLQIAKNIAKNSYNKAEKGILQELNKNYDIIKQVTSSLVKFHQLAVTESCGKLTEKTLVDRRYKHLEYVRSHLEFLHFILQEGVLYLPMNRAKELWNTLVANPDACEWDRETCLAWFTKGISDLEQETQSQLFQKEFLKMNPEKLTFTGFECLKLFFENVNTHEHRMKRTGVSFLVEKTDLIGLDFLWELCLQTQNEELSESAISLLISMSYTNLSAKIKKDAVTLHKKFIDECYKRLELARLPLGGSVIAKCLLDANRIMTAVTMPNANLTPSPSRQANLLAIERLLLLAERYITTVEEQHAYPRTILAHGASFQGQPLNLYVICESPKMDFSITVHRNETVGSFRHKIADKLKQGSLKQSPENVQIVVNDKVLNKEHKLLHQLGIEDNQVISVRAMSASSYSAGTDASSIILASSHTSHSLKSSFELEQERMLPGVVMAAGGHVFEMLYQLSDLDQPKITSRARNLLKLIPTDPSVQDTLDSLGEKPPRQSSPEPPSPKLSPRNSPRKMTPTITTTTTPTLTPSTSNTSLNRTSCVSKEVVLRSLFSASAQDMSTFRVLYNLEVLSSKLMPTVRDMGTLQSAKSFCEDFLNADGLSLVVHVLQKDAIPADVDYESRQGCYAIALQLLRFLLCGQDTTGEPVHSSVPRRGSSTGSAGAGSLSGTPSLEVTPAAASRAIQTMTVGDFTETVGCFLRVAWAAAAGKLHLASSSATSFVRDAAAGSSSSSSRSRQSSTGSNGSSGSEADNLHLHAGVCAKQKSVSAKDSNIAKEALELLVTCLQLRHQLLPTFYSLPCTAEFIIDLLVGSPQPDIRDAALDQFYLLSQTSVENEGENDKTTPTPHYFMLHTLLKARLPFWVQSSSTRGASQKLLHQCTQYFDLRCRLLGHLSVASQKQLGVDVHSMIEDEIDWLQNFVISTNPDQRETDNMLIAGHLRLIKTLLSCEGIDKKDIVRKCVHHISTGKSLVQDLLHNFLFPASKIIMDSPAGLKLTDAATGDFSAKCSNSDSRVAAYEVLLELADGCNENFSVICRDLLSMHHAYDPELSTQWDHMPPVESRSSAGFVGLKNGGATCYMNSVIQQLYMTPGVYEALLSTDHDDTDEDSVFFQIQQVLGHLLESRLKYYVPDKFWNVFKLWGQLINVREQQDAFDFYTVLVDQLEEQLKKWGKESIFKKKFQGVFSDQKICKDCPHRYEREEVFYALNVTVKNATLQDSLTQFVKGELLDGDNAYFCEKCGEKRNTIKRMCIKNLPNVLCIQLKRFSWDWETNRALKFDDYFKFPWQLDMEPYTAEGLAHREREQEGELLEEVSNSSSSGDSQEALPTLTSSPPPLTTTVASDMLPPRMMYELVGVVVHNGQANAGHYHSFIKDRRGDYLTNPNKGKWYKFNDTDVTEVEMSDTFLETECFGGSYKAKVIGDGNSLPEDRLRCWNGYLLFYERVETVRTPVSAKKSKVIRKVQHEHSSSLQRSSDSFVELTELVHKGEKRGLFTDKMPARIEQEVRAENLKFMKNRDVYDSDYFKFIRNLATRNVPLDGKVDSELCLQSIQLSVRFLNNTYFRTKRRLRQDLQDWTDAVERNLSQCRDACMWIVEYFSIQEGKDYIRPFLLECPSKEIRCAFVKILEATITQYLHHGAMPIEKCFNEFIEILLSMLDKDVVDHCKTCSQYFNLLQAYVQLGTKAITHMFGRQAFTRLATFLLGGAGSSSPGDQQSSSGDNGTRRWSSLQARDFAGLHETLATLVLNCDIGPYRTEAVGDYKVVGPVVVSPQIFLKMSPDMHKYVFGQHSLKYISEVVLAVREIPYALIAVEDMLVYCSFCNGAFSMNVIKNIMRQYATAPCNELKGLLAVLMSLLCIKDPLQLKRLKCVIDGYQDDMEVTYEGMLSVIKSNTSTDSRRSYQLIKFLVNLSNRCAMAKEYLLSSPINWQWSVNWLKKKMTEYYWNPNTAATTSNEDSTSKTFQRTISAQTTLEEATDLLKEIVDQETGNASSSGAGDMEVVSTTSLEEENSTSSSVVNNTHPEGSK